MKLDDILTMWEQDAVIDDIHLDNSSIATSKLHAKYLRLLTHAKLKRTKTAAEYATMRRVRFRYYRGELTKNELQQYGWDQWQYNRPLKTEMDEFLKGDPETGKLQSRIEYLDTMISTLESIITQLRQRDWQIKSVIEYRKFIAGT